MRAEDRKPGAVQQVGAEATSRVRSVESAFGLTACQQRKTGAPTSGFTGAMGCAERDLDGSTNPALLKAERRSPSSMSIASMRFATHTWLLIGGRSSTSLPLSRPL